MVQAFPVPPLRACLNGSPLELGLVLDLSGTNPPSSDRAPYPIDFCNQSTAKGRFLGETEVWLAAQSHYR